MHTRGLLICVLYVSSFSAMAQYMSGELERGVCSAGADCPVGCTCTPLSTTEAELLVDCTNQAFTHLPTKLPLTMSDLRFSGNKLHVLYNGSFAGCANLIHLDLSSNSLQNLETKAFRGIEQLQTLLLNNNSIDFNKVSASIWDNMTQLSVLSIQDNLDNLVSGVTYNDLLFASLTGLRRLTIDGLRNATFGPGFSGLHSLQYLNIQGSLKYLTNSTFESLNRCPLKTLELRSGVLTDVDMFSFAHFKQLQTLDLSFNKLLGFKNASKSWYGLQYTKITNLILKRSAPYNSQIVRIKRDFYKYLELTKLKKLVLDANNIITIEAVFSFHTRHLEHLSLAYNNIVQILGFVIDVFFLPNLKTLDVSFQARRLVTPDEMPKPASARTSEEGPGHSSKHLPELGWEGAQGHLPDLFSNLTLLKELHLQGSVLIENVGYINKTMPLPPGTMYLLCPPRLRSLQVAASLTMNYDTLSEIIMFGHNQLHHLNYSQNNMRNIIGPLIVKSPPPQPISVDFSYNSCSYVAPSFANQSGHLMGELLLHHNNLGSQLEDDNNGSILNHYFELTKLDLSHNNIKSLPDKTLTNLTKLSDLDLSFNSIRLTGFLSRYAITPNLKLVNLSGNLLDKLDQETRLALDMAGRESNLTVDLAGNPLQCTCESLQFLKWLPHTKVHFTNWHRYTCMYEGGLVPLLHLESSILPKLVIECSSKTWLIAVSVVLVSIVILIVVSAILYRHRFEVRYLCLKVFMKGQLQFPEETNHIEFDAFVGFHELDVNWVDDHLIPQLDSQEGEGVFKLFLHHRDVLYGEHINNVSERALKRSRKIILLLSQHFVESFWCDTELLEALSRCFKERKELIIPILLEENLPTGKLTSSLRALLRRNTYLEWPEDVNERPNFWINLKRALTSAPDRIIRCQCGNTMTV